MIISSFIKMSFIRRLMLRIYGPLYLNPLKSQDNIDPITLEEIWTIKKVDGVDKKILSMTIPHHLTFSYMDGSGKFRMFNMTSLLKLFKGGGDIKHPLTREIIPYNIKINLDRRVLFMLKHDLIDTKFLREVRTLDELIKENAFEIFSIMAKHNVYLDYSNFLLLNRYCLKQMLIELNNMWYHPGNKHLPLFIGPLLVNYNKLVNDESYRVSSSISKDQVEREINIYLFNKDEYLSSDFDSLTITSSKELKNYITTEILNLFYLLEISEKCNFINSDDKRKYEQNISFYILSTLVYVMPQAKELYGDFFDLQN